ncbi:MMPL family transporter [Spirosoma sp. RP8]|uniref:MMPL family transporter n=1 Tax=Spirosoma liriopis TaxID=2937440 RepID=A0ABT0HE00_9BACT|nr:MMPL family transporter [Spirosoma liriopis]MCK8490392.1 MMPL family transporter [Spirosoma liriopis]
MWKSIARGILKLRLFWLTVLIIVTIVMGNFGTRLQLSYQPARVLPLSDSTQQHYEDFKQRFGIDGSVMIVGWQDKRWFDLPVYQSWYDMTEQVRKLPGVKDALSISRLYTIARQDTTWGIKQVVTQRPQTQQQVDSLQKKILDLPFYDGLLVNPETKSTLMAISLDEKTLNTKDRLGIVAAIRQQGDTFAKKTGITVHYSGLPSIRTEVSKRVAGELKLFTALAVAVTGLLVWLLFRSWKVVVLSLTVVLMGVCFAVGALVLFGYEMTVLTGLLPPLLIVIGIPNCVFLINKYNAELAEHGQKQRALENTIEEIGLASFLANVTTAIGFGVFYFTNSRLLVEFGLVAAVCVLAVYVICLLMVPIILSYLPVPKTQQGDSTEVSIWRGTLTHIDNWVHHKRPLVYGLIAVITVISALGLPLIRIEGFVVDDLPKNDPVYNDMRFFEAQFKGALPFEVTIDTGKPNGILAGTGSALYKIRAMERIIAQYPEFSKPRSLVDAIRFAYQSYRGGAPKYYVLPPALALHDMVAEAPIGVKSSPSSSLTRSYIDSSRQVARVSYQMADIGSIRMQEVLGKLQPRIDSLFRDTGYKVSLTGHSLVFLKSNDYLLGNLYESLGIAILLIALVGMVLFRSVPIILMSKLPCLIPLLVTAGIMGYTDIAFKPSTILIFSIAFGLSSDGTVYFLTSYRQQLQRGLAPSAAISAAIHETGVSLIYTALILAGGFSVFAASGFGGTAALGVLVATTVLMACLTNLILLPALLLSLKRYRV